MGRSSAAKSKWSLGECRWVPTGRDQRHEMQVCRNGRGKTGYQIKAGTRRPKR